ncbi:MAG: hypothetical protein KJ888_20565 [Gammaproteobacteria bacterium]|nr:hypothetical protein [Gammaproteobacteria bacterium]
MNYRLATILDREAISADMTKVIDINLADPVSQFQIVYEVVNGNQAAGDGHPAKCVTKIELVDGSEVLYSLSGQEAQAVDWYHNKKEPPNIVLYTNGMNSEMIFNMNFGRFLYDPLFAFAPKKFTNPQLKITIDLNAGGSLSSSGYLTVLAQIFDGRTVEPTGFMMHKEINNYSMGSASHEYVDLPVDFPIRKLLIMAQTYGTGPEYLINKIKLSEDNDRRVPVNHTMFELLRNMAQQTPPYREWIIGPGTSTAQYFYCTPCYWPAFACAGWRATIGGGDKNIYEGGGGRFKYIQTGEGPNWQAHVEGWAPHGVLEIPFGLQNEPDDWFDVSKLGNLRLDILSGSGRSSTDTVQVFLQQLRKYAG